MELKVFHSMNAPHLDKNDNLNLILRNSAQLELPKVDPGTVVYWNDQHYGLDHASFFIDLSEEKRSEIIQQLNHWSLSLSYFIEKFGLNYGAKMVLMSESVEEKSLYTLFSADEVRHRIAIEPFVTKSMPSDLNFHPLLPALALALEQGSKAAMTFTIQVVLEGFGLSHYFYLRDSCLSPELKSVFNLILEDEVLHHGMGVYITQNLALSPEDKEQITELTALFIRALKEASWVLKTVEQAHGGLTLSQRYQFKEEIGWHQQIQQRMERVKVLLRKVGYHELVESLEQKGVFEAS